ncbi:tail fiber domain-containing protein [Salmonella enterica subsp. enterica]|nr:tail fiber domain-containing protein [Salmonella enterica subsp. enterica]
MTVNIDNHSKRLNLPLPDESNFLQDDCARIRESFNIIDQKAATLDTLGKLEVSQLPDKAVQYTSADLLPEDKLPPSVVLVDTTGKIPVSQLPPAGVTNIRDVSSESAMLALPATPGDVANRLDVGERYVLAGADATRLANWRILPQTAVTSINGETGAVTGYAKLKPIASSIAMALEGVNGPLRLMADAADDYDAVTLKQLKSVQSVGAGGATMSGVMNNFIGAVEWFNGSRLNLPAGYIAADGQLENRNDAKVADLWTAVKAGILNVVPDADWTGNVNTNPEDFGKNRAKYSWGLAANGTQPGTKDQGDTFRVPDLNGKKVNGVDGWGYGTSSPALHLRGDTFGVNGTVEAGTVSRNAAPNIVGSSNPMYWQAQPQAGAAGNAFAGVKGSANVAGNTGTPNVLGMASFTFDASRSAASYGRDNTTEVRPNSAVGIWIIRASGAFQAANTAFNVIAGDAKAPAAGTLIAGGQLVSKYQLAGTPHISANFAVRGKFLQDGYAAIQVVDDTGVVPTKEWKFHSGGDTDCPSTLSFGNSLGRFSAALATPIDGIQLDAYSPTGKVTRFAVGGGYMTRRGVLGPWGGNASPQGGSGNLFNFDWGSASGNAINVSQPIELWIDTINIGVVSIIPASDRLLKEQIQPLNKAGALQEVKQWETVSFRYKGREHIPQSLTEYGFIANDLVKVSPECVRGHGLKEGYDPKNPVGAYHLNQMAIIVKLTQAIQVLADKVEKLEAKLGS